MIFRQDIWFNTCSQHRRNAVNHVCKWHVNRKICSYQRCYIFTGGAFTTRFQIFRKSMHKELQFCSCKHSMIDPLEEPRQSAPNLYASDITPWELNMAASSWILVNYSFKLYLLFMFLTILDFIDGVHISSCQSNAPYIYIYIYICL